MTSPGGLITPLSSQATLASRTSEAIGRPPDRRTGVVVSFASNKLMVSVGGGEAEEVGFIDTYAPLVGDVVILILQRSTWVCIGRLAATGAALPVRSGEILGGILSNSIASVTFNDGVEHLIPGYSFTVTVPVGHLIELHATWTPDNNTSDADFPFYRIKQDGVTAHGSYKPCLNGHVGHQVFFSHWFVPIVTAAHTYTITAQRAFGTATFDVFRDVGDVFLAIDHGVPQNLAQI